MTAGRLTSGVMYSRALTIEHSRVDKRKIRIVAGSGKNPPPETRLE
jgi:hypothetical protein